MYVTTSYFIVLALFLQTFENRECKVIKYEEILLKSGEFTLKFVPNKDSSSEYLGKILFMLRDDQPASNTASEKALPDPNFVPNLVNKIGITSGKCPFGYKWRGVVGCLKT